MSQLESHFHLHHLPLVTLGSGRITLADKYGTLMHAFFLEGGPSRQEFSSYCQSFCSLTTDYGVEHGLASVEPAEVESILPWFVETAGEVPMQSCVEWEGESDQSGDVADDGRISLQGCLAAPGMLHILHNATNDMVDALPEIKGATDDLAELSTFLRRQYTAQRFMDSCLDSPAGKLWHKDFKQFNAKVHSGRWGSLAFATSSVLDLRHPLVRWWSLEKYNGVAENRQAADAAQTEDGCRVQAVERAISTPMFWGHCDHT